MRLTLAAELCFAVVVKAFVMLRVRGAASETSFLKYDMTMKGRIIYV
jgi:hypothetical protein